MTELVIMKMISSTRKMSTSGVMLMPAMMSSSEFLESAAISEFRFRENRMQAARQNQPTDLAGLIQDGPAAVAEDVVEHHRRNGHHQAEGRGDEGLRNGQ